MLFRTLIVSCRRSYCTACIFAHVVCIVGRGIGVCALLVEERRGRSSNMIDMNWKWVARAHTQNRPYSWYCVRNWQPRG